MKQLKYMYLLLILAGCKTLEQPEQPNTKVIGGKTYQVDNDGNVLIGKMDLASGIKSGEFNFIHSKEANPHTELSSSEFSAVSADNAVLFSMAGIKKSKNTEHASLIKKGSLKGNLKRLVAEHNWGDLYYEGPDLFIEKPYIVKGENFESLINEVLLDYDVFLCFDENDRSVTVIQTTPTSEVDG